MPFADFVAGLVKRRLAGEPLPAVPTEPEFVAMYWPAGGWVVSFNGQ